MSKFSILVNRVFFLLFTAPWRHGITQLLIDLHPLSATNRASNKERQAPVEIALRVLGSAGDIWGCASPV